MKDELENVLNKDTTSRQIIVFCTSVDSCRAVDYHLLAKGFDIVSLHGAIPPKKRTEMYEKFQSQKTRILVCTDLASRGLDTVNVC
jgi:superfamily II DNA/RNA helicase